MSVRILHTADLHFGKKLHGFDLQDQQALFVSWLCDIIRSENIDQLLVSGDVFDLANPSSDSMKMYYEMLKAVSDTGCGVIITGGNHDSASLLNAPASLLQHFNITVIGSAPEDVTDCLVPIYKEGKLAVVIVAVPYLRDSDIRKPVSGETYSDKLLAVKEGIRGYYDSVAASCSAIYPGKLVIAAGHLYAAGADGSESEREIQIGNLAGVDAGTFNPLFSYVALGHIHKPQQVGNQDRIFYSGSPYPLSFSERAQKKFIRIITIADDELSNTQIQVPDFRELIRLTGTLEEIRTAISNYSSHNPLPALAELELKEEIFDPSVISRKEALISEVNQRSDIRIVHSKVTFLNQPLIEAEKFENEHDLSPYAIFNDLLKEMEEDKRSELLAAFAEITENLNEEAAK